MIGKIARVVKRPEVLDLNLVLIYSSKIKFYCHKFIFQALMTFYYSLGHVLRKGLYQIARAFFDYEHFEIQIMLDHIQRYIQPF